MSGNHPDDLKMYQDFRIEKTGDVELDVCRLIIAGLDTLQYQSQKIRILEFMLKRVKEGHTNEVG